jgi:hypothetical protein
VVREGGGEEDEEEQWRKCTHTHTHTHTHIYIYIQYTSFKIHPHCQFVSDCKSTATRWMAICGIVSMDMALASRAFNVVSNDAVSHRSWRGLMCWRAVSSACMLLSNAARTERYGAARADPFATMAVVHSTGE